MTTLEKAIHSQGRRLGSRRALIGFAVGLVFGAASIVHATVACGTFDRTTMTLTSIRKNGVEQPLPAQRNGGIERYYASATVIDPETGMAVEVTAERTVSP